jgi:two-component system, response regulator, stage 0 sporulation protein F
MGSKIMVVDDEPGIRDLLAEILSGRGFDVTSAKDGTESLQYMQEDAFDLLITDINMPHLNGIELLKRMKTAGRKERVVIMTGGVFDCSDITNELPFISFQLKKPFRMDELLQVVSLALMSKRRDRPSQMVKKTSKKDGKCYLN